MTKLIELNDVSVRYGTCEALSHVYLDIHPQDFLGIIGPNGGGKTTLVKAILKAVPYTGKVIYSKEIESGGYRRIGYMPQISDLDKTFPISVREVVLSGLQARKKLFGRYTSADREKAENLLGRALISDPKLLILDEPTNFVDNRFEKELYALLKQFNDKMAIVMVSHDLGTISSHVKQIVCVNRHVHRHDSNRITAEQLHNYDCPIQVVFHGDVPHTVLEKHS